MRPPLVDHELLELAITVPSELKIRSGESKWILRELARDRLPPEVTVAPKHGFEIPVDTWLRGPLEDRFHSEVLENPGLAEWVRLSTVRRMWKAHRRGWRRCGPTLWSLLVLGAWLRRYTSREVGDHRDLQPAIPCNSSAL